MSNEISASITLNVSKSGVTLNQSFSKTSDMAGAEMIGNTQTVGTSAETLTVGDVSTIGYLLIKNLDSTNFVEIDAVSTMDSFPQKVLAGESILLKPQTATIYGKADTAACSVYVQAVEL